MFHQKRYKSLLIIHGMTIPIGTTGEIHQLYKMDFSKGKITTTIDRDTLLANKVLQSVASSISYRL